MYVNVCYVSAGAQGDARERSQNYHAVYVILWFNDILYIGKTHTAVHCSLEWSHSYHTHNTLTH